MGGNSRAVNSDGSIKLWRGKEAYAHKLDLTLLPRSEIQKSIIAALHGLNEFYFAKYNKYIWESSVIDLGHIFNGSSRSFFDSTIPDAEFIQYKRWLGDVDVTVPKIDKRNLFVLLDDLQETMISPGMIYVGSNKPTILSIGEQINAVFEFSQANTLLQIDFEFVDFTQNRPTEWALFSKSADWEDQTLGIKGVFHKYLIRALVRNIYIMPDIVVLTPHSKTTSEDHLQFLNDLLTNTSDTKKIKQLSREIKQLTPRLSLPYSGMDKINFYTFSILYGMRDKITLCHDDDGNATMIGKRRAVKFLEPANSNYISDPDGIFEGIFNKRCSDDSRKLFQSFHGICTLIVQQSLDPIPIINDFIELLWGNIDRNIKGQALDRDNKNIDHSAKTAALNFLCARTRVTIDTSKLEDWYYANY